MRSLWKSERFAIAISNDDDALSMLRHPVARGVHDLPNRMVVRTRLAIDLIDTEQYPVKTFALALVNEAGNVLEQEGFWLRVAQYT